MKIKDYLDKNYPSINWNILSQLFEEEEIELTEEIRDYLDTTPWNTNCNILADWGIDGYDQSEEGEDTPVVKKAYYTLDQNYQLILDVSKSDFSTHKEVFDYCAKNFIKTSEEPEKGIINNFELYNGIKPVHTHTPVYHSSYNEEIDEYEWFDENNPDKYFDPEEPAVYILSEKQFGIWSI